MSTLPKTTARLVFAIGFACTLARVVAAHAETVEAREIPTVIKRYSENALAFDSSYRDYVFFDTLPLQVVRRTAGARYQAVFTAPNRTAVTCPLGDRFEGAEAMFWTSGQQIKLAGNIVMVEGRTLVLRDCKFEATIATR